MTSTTRSRTQMLSAEKEAELLDRYLDHGDMNARQRLILAYLPLAKNAAQTVAQRGKVPLEDLCQEAAIALSNAIDRFDRSKNARISTIARYYIRSALMQYVMGNNGIVRVGTNTSDKRLFMNMRRMVAEIERETGAPLTDKGRQQIADELDVKLEAVKRMEPRIFASDSYVSPTDVVDEDENGKITSAGIVIEGEQRNVEGDIDGGRVMHAVRTIIARSYSGRDLEIIESRLSEDFDKEVVSELSEKHNITPERIRQIQRSGLETARVYLESQGISCLDDVSI